MGTNHRQTIGQRLMLGFDGTEMNPDLAFLIGTLKIGGLILFSRNVESPDQVRRLCRACQDQARQSGQPPLLIAVDQEGGPVARLRAPFTEFEGAAKMADESEADRFARITAEELSGVGINMNMAPVLDLAPEGIDSIMADRSFGPDPDRVGRMGRTIICRMQAGGVMAVGKHFPGIGRTTLDSHVDMPVLQIDPALLDRTDLVPFRAAVDCQVAGMMLSHVRYPSLDPDRPASISKPIASDLLRHRLGFDGLILTDDLDMGAIRRQMDFTDAVSGALDAQVDVVLICHRSPDMEAAAELILSAVENSPAMREAHEGSVGRILAIKQKFLGNWSNG